MKREPAEHFLKLLGAKVQVYQNRTGWVVSTCPLGPWRHTDGKSGPDVFGIKTKAGDSFVHCFSCGYSGSQSALVMEMSRLNKQIHQADYKFGDILSLIMEAEESLELDGLNSPDIEEMLFENAGKADHIFSDWWFSTFTQWHKVKFAQDYLESRGISAQVANHLDIRVDIKENRVCFPVRDFSNNLRGLHGRLVGPPKQDHTPRYRMYTQGGHNNPLIWLGEHWLDLDKPVVIVEGPMDLAKVYAVYRNVASPLFSNPNHKKINRIADAMEVITLMDRGTGGDSGRKKFSHVLKNSVVTHLVPPEPYDDPGEMPIDEIAILLEGFVPLDKFLE